MGVNTGTITSDGNTLLLNNVLRYPNGGRLAMFSTLAEMKAFVGGSEPMAAYCNEKESVYLYCSDCAATADDDLVVTTAEGGTTRWEMLGKMSRNFGDTGWSDKDNATLTKLSATQVRLALSSVGILAIKGVRRELAAGNYDFTITGAAGTKFLYFNDGTGVIKQRDDLWDFNAEVPIATVLWDGAAITAMPTTEFHGIRDNIWHLYQHRYFGVQYLSGLTATGSEQTDNNVNPPDATCGFLWFTSGVIQDEDAQATPGTGQWAQTLGSGLTNTTAAILPFLYFNGTQMVGQNAMSDRAPFIHAGGTTFPQWNNGGTLQAAVSGDYVVYHYFSTPMVGGWSVFGRPHNAVFTSLSTALLASHTSLTWTGLAEMKHIYTAIYRCGTGFTNAEHRAKLVSLRSFRLTPGTPTSGISATDHQALSNRNAANAHPVGSIVGSLAGCVPFTDMTSFAQTESQQLHYDQTLQALHSTSFFASSSYGGLGIRKSRSNTIGTLTATNRDEMLGELSFYGTTTLGAHPTVAGCAVGAMQYLDAATTYTNAHLIFSTSQNGGAMTEYARLYNNGNFGFRVKTPQTTLHAATSAASGTGTFGCYSSTTAHSPAIALQKSHTNTLETKTQTLDTEALGTVGFEGVNSSGNFAQAAAIYASQTGSAGATYIAGELSFYTGTSSAAPAARMKITSTGRLLTGDTTKTAQAVGTITPIIQNLTNTAADRCHVLSTHFSADAVGPCISLGKSRSATVGTLTTPNSQDSLGQYQFCGAQPTTDAAFNVAAYIEGAAQENWSSTAQGAKMNLVVTPPTTKTPVNVGVITSSGWEIGRTGTSSQSHIIYGSSSTGDETIRLYKSGIAANQESNYYMGFFASVASATDGYIIVSGNALTFSETSDARKKTNVKNPTNWGLNSILALRPVEYDMPSKNLTGQKGFIAQEVKTVLPDCITTKDETKFGGYADQHMLLQSKMIPVIVQAIKELKALVDTKANRP